MRKPVLIIIAVVAAVALVWAAVATTKKPVTRDTANSSQASDTPGTTQQQADPGTEPSGGAPTAQAATVITYGNDGFSPASVTVKSGDTVVIKNMSNRMVEFDSDPHPAHTDNEELNNSPLSPGKERSFIVKRQGTFGYHNHLNSSETGAITVR